MKYCTKCGAKLMEGAKFCTVCGSSADTSAPAENVQAIPVRQEPDLSVDAAFEAPASGGRKKRKWWLLAVIIPVVAALAAAAVFLIPRLTMNAPKRFVEIHKAIVSPVVEGSAKALTGESESALPEKVREYTGIDTDFTVTADVETGDSYADKIINDSSVTFKVKQGGTDKPLYGFKLNLSGSDILSGTIVPEQDRIGIYLPELSDDYYQIRYEDLGDILSALGIDTKVDIEDLLAAAENKESPLGVDSEKLKAIIDSYLDVFFSMVNEENTTSAKEDVKLPGCGQTVSCTVITFKPTADDITDMVRQLCDKLKDDEDVREIVKNLAEYVYKASPDLARQYPTSKEFVNYTLESYDDTVRDLWNDNKDEIKSFARDVEKNEVCWKVAYKGTRIHAITITDDDDNGIGYESVGNVLESRKDMIVLYDEGDPETYAESEIKVKGKIAEGELRVYHLDDGTAVVEYSVDLAKKSGLNIPYGDISFKYGEVKVNLSVSGDDTGSVHDIKLRIDDTPMKFRISSTDEPSTVTEPKGAATRVTSDNVMGILQNIYEKVSEIAMNLF
ncbi:MAG: zinc ribbon domain-containing protein [Oscillospiraceae bacterium]|nr:zinc ribbon domain-containing protein [Oscillospiraceae bacterium]